MRYGKAAGIFGVIAVACAAAFFYHQSSIKTKDIESLTVENKINSVVIKDQVETHIKHQKASESYEEKARHIDSEKVKAKKELEVLFDEVADGGTVDSDRLTNILLNYQDSLRASTKD